MKKIGLIGLVLTFIILGCNQTNGNKTENIGKPEKKTEEKKSEIKPEYLTFETFKEKVWDFEKHPKEWVYKGETPCVIDFYADWCRPCKMIAPIMEELAVKYDGKVKIFKIDTQKEQDLARIFQIRSIPAVLFSPVKGQPTMQAGALPRDSYIKIIETNLLNNQENKTN
ncbi:MAG: thiol reductase thioredoxin [Bacteroidales bacterium]|nr:thiol reductase thioredoxin [Bacteroidales bacterium]